MSHFTVMVIGDDFEKQLAPYHEFECTGTDNEYVLDVDKTEEFKKEWEDHKNDYSTQAEFAYEWYGWKSANNRGELDLSDEHKYGYVLVNDEGVVEKAVDRTNPSAKWDWYQLGGRWSGLLKLKEGAEGVVGPPSFFGTPASEGYVDQAKKGDIDFEGMYAEAERKAHKKYDLLERLTEGLTPPMTWKETLEQYGTGRIDEAREYLQNSPWMKAVNKSDELRTFFGDIVEDMCVHTGGRNAYVEKSRCSAITTFAVVKDGVWYEKGEMGWWGIVTNEKDQQDWNQKFMDLIEGLPDETLITIVDCHI